MGDRGGRTMNDLYRKVREAEVESYPTGRKSWVPIYERVEPDLEAVASLLAAAYMGVPVSAEQIVNAALGLGADGE